jgi:hypothetical protein
MECVAGGAAGRAANGALRTDEPAPKAGGAGRGV